MSFVRIMKFRKCILGFILASHFVALAQAQANTAQPISKEYYTVNEQQLEQTGTTRSDFSAFTQNFSPDSFIQRARVLVVNLLRWTLHNDRLQEPTERYMRKLHFGRWINDPTDDTCMNTRAKVLVRDSTGTVTYKGGRECVVDNGLWQDPYAGEEVTSSRGIQIDHMVPLKNAYTSGAWKWDYKTRCLYANYMGFNNHLISSSAHENMSKGDRAPDKYLPPNLSYRCQYIKNWLAVKLIWRLNMTSNEVHAIYEVANNYGCNLDDFKFSKQHLDEQREFINDNLEFCMINKR